MRINYIQFFFFLLLFSTPILNGQDFNPCPLTITLDKGPVIEGLNSFYHFEKSGNLVPENCGEGICNCSYKLDWVKTVNENGENVNVPEAAIFYNFNLFWDPNNKVCDEDSWMDLPDGISEPVNRIVYRDNEFRIYTVFGVDDLFNDPVVTKTTVQSITENIVKQLNPFAHTSDCGPLSDIDFIAATQITDFPNCPTESFNTLMQNAWPEVGDEDFLWFFGISDAVPDKNVGVHYFISTDQVFSNDDLLLAETELITSDFIGNETYGYSFSKTIEIYVDGGDGNPVDPDAIATIDMSNYSLGIYFIFQSIDPLNEIVETNENNNVSLIAERLVISSFQGGNCDCCPNSAIDEDGNEWTLITEEPNSQFSSTGGRVTYRTGSDSYYASCGYERGNRSQEIGRISWQDRADFIRSTVGRGGSDADFCDIDEYVHDVRPDLTLLGFYEPTTDFSRIGMRVNNQLLASAYASRVASRSLLCLEKECEGYTDSSETSILLFDANPQFISLDIFGTGSVDNIREILDETELEDAVRESRLAVSCDGVSEVLLRAPVSSEPAFAVWELEDEKFGKIETPWASRTVKIDDQDYVYAIYTPPSDLSQLDTKKNAYDVLSTRIPIEFSYEHESELVVTMHNIELVAPPVVLVHGTFDNPDNCWRTPLSGDDSITLTSKLEEEGLKYWTVDYSQSNGSKESSFLFNTASSFKANQKVVYENSGGIKEAIDSYRGDYNIAATRADVIGHSMGGVLPRVYASTSDYKRSQNFNAGDINRLISIASTHHGSDLSYFGHFFNKSWSDLELPLQQRLANSAFIYGQWLISGIAETDAVRNQLPASEELRDIGPTDIPSHAIVCTINDFEEIRNDPGDQETKQYEDLYEGLASVFYFYPGGITGFFLNLIRTYKRHPESQRQLLTGSDFSPIASDRILGLRRGSDIDEIADQVAEVFSNQWETWQVLMDDEDSNWIIDDDRYLLSYKLTESNYFDTDDNSRTYISQQQYDLISGEELQEEFDPDVNLENRDKVIDYLRYVIFRNDLNDGVVRYESQRGGLEKEYISHFKRNLHGYAPRYPLIIDRITALLMGGVENFAPDGFPSAGDRLAMEIPDPKKMEIPPSINFKVGCEAACWSGMVPAHANAFAKVAGEENKVILARPVNPDATPLIMADAATKGMKLKGKSSNWGPQRGYITENQRYSKIWQQFKDDPATRKIEIEDYNKKVYNLLREDPDIAVTRQLELVYEECKIDSFYVFIDSDIADAEQSLFLATDTTDIAIYYKWDITDNDGCPINEENAETATGHLVALNVIANPDPDLLIDDKPRYYTADYDLLAIGFYDQRLAGNQKDLCPYPTLPPFNNATGLITPQQEDLLDNLNESVKTDAMYNGGNVSHHGPENQFYVLDNPIKGSPYVDYPITAFYPENKRSKKGKIMSIPRGPAGFRDIYLKRFMAEKRREGYDLYDNIHSPGWNWRKRRDYSFSNGWSDRDAPNLPDSPEQIPFPNNCECDKSQIGIDQYQKELDLFTQPIVRNNVEEISLFPNPTTQSINSSISSKKVETINYSILDYAGRSVSNGIIPLLVGDNRISIDVSHLSEGMYFLVFSSEGKIVSKSFVIGF